MHGYYWRPERLQEKLREFVGGQFLMERKDGLVFRGEVKSFSFPNPTEKVVIIEFAWLCERRFGLDTDRHGTWKSVPRWTKLEVPSGSPCLTLPYSSYYFQRKRDVTDKNGGRDQRIKMWGYYGKEICRFFTKDDPTNIVEDKNNMEFLPRYEALGVGPED